MEKQFLTTLYVVCFILSGIQAQNVGIGTSSPAKLLSVKGTVLVDAGNQNAASPDSAALLFGTTTKVGILCNRTAGGTSQHGLSFFTGNTQRLLITSAGYVGIGQSNPSYTLDVNGSIRSSSTIFTQGSMSASFDLIAGDDLFVNDDATISGNVGIGTSPSGTYRMVVSGDTRYYDNVGMDGTLRVNERLTNQGKGIMLSNSATTLRSGFTSGTFSLTLGAGASSDVVFYVTPFSGNNSNIRVMVAQFTPGSGASSNWGSVIMTPTSPLASDPGYSNNSTVRIRMHNAGSSTVNLGSGAVLYLYSVVTHVDP